MKASAVLINIGRGAVVDEAALVAELPRLRGAALDVFEVEPLPESSPLWSMPNVLISPHSADHTADSHARAMDFFLRNLARFEKGEALENVVDFDKGY
jgi:phosphoglycerate dehydrogenase-like enzyme